jgi:hypothetical protein
MAYNVLMNVDDILASTCEITRVSRPSGTVVVSIVHPIADQGHFAGEGSHPQLILSDSYFHRRHLERTEEHDGMQMHFAGWSQPLGAYFAAFEQSGLTITSLREPLPCLRPGQDHLLRWSYYRLFLWLKTRLLPQ